MQNGVISCLRLRLKVVQMPLLKFRGGLYPEANTVKERRPNAYIIYADGSYRLFTCIILQYAIAIQTLATISTVSTDMLYEAKSILDLWTFRPFVTSPPGRFTPRRKHVNK